MKTEKTQEKEEPTGKVEEIIAKEIVPVVEEAKIEVEKDVITELPEEEAVELEKEGRIDLSKLKTSVGIKVRNGEIKNIDQILDNGLKILEAEIVDVLLPNTQTELLMIGQSKGKFGGGQRRIFKQTQKKTPEGNKPSFACFAIVGNGDGYVGGGLAKSKDTVPAREKAIRKAKLNVFKIRRGCGSWQCGCKTPHSIPFAVRAKCGSVIIELLPAPKGKGLCIETECAKILKLAGIKDVWSRTFGQTKVKQNLIMACLDALKGLMEVKIHSQSAEKVGMIEGRTRAEAQ